MEPVSGKVSLLDGGGMDTVSDAWGPVVRFYDPDVTTRPPFILMDVDSLQGRPFSRHIQRLRQSAPQPVAP